MVFTKFKLTHILSMGYLFCLSCWCFMLLSLSTLQCVTAREAEISNHIRKCCISGLRHATEHSNCQNYEYEVQMSIPPLWRGLCLSTYSVCCSREIEQQHCTAGRQAALTGTRCDEPHNGTAYADCCRACQVGLAVKASENNCEDALFAYFAKIESYRICCGDGDDDDDDGISGGNGSVSVWQAGAAEQDGKTTQAASTTAQGNSHAAGSFDDEDEHGDVDGGAIVLPEDDDDICGKVPNLCQQICENTKEAYRCKCRAGYTLDPNNVTCTSAIKNNMTTSQENVTYTANMDDVVYNENGTEDDDDEEPDEEEEQQQQKQEVPGTKKSCLAGYELSSSSLDGATRKCVDINECAQPHLTKCHTNQYCHNTIGSYRCLSVKGAKQVCRLGTLYNTKTDICEDIDECEEQLPCEYDYDCVNTLGSYECRKRSAGGAATEPSKSSQLLLNTLKCGDGFQQKHGRCVDIDECAVDDQACDSSQLCTNDIGGYHCDCKIGFNLDTTTNACVDINECSINNHNCLSTQRCDNTVGSYICTRLQSCGTGYTLNAETGNCVDDDECALNTHNCPAGYDCFNTKGSFRCYRRPTSTSTTTTVRTTASSSTSSTTAAPTAHWASLYGGAVPSSAYGNASLAGGYVSQQTYSRQHAASPLDYASRYVGRTATNYLEREQERQPDWARRRPPCDIGFQRNHLGACVDINECVQQQACGSHQRCINTNGSYRCQNLLQCSAGYKSTPDGAQCVDIDECETNEHNCADNQICRNRQGGYICACPPGHQLQRLPNTNYQRCVDIDECEQERPSVCPLNAMCLNTIGSYYCECKSGFQKSADNERNCLDVDECQEIPGLCQQKCVNFWGGYRCSCNHGYELSVDNRTCNDVDECEVHKAFHLCMGFCINVPGSYECSCPRGYTLGMDRNSCRDIDECATGEVCTGRNDICTNIRGSYKCTTIHCPYNYVNDPEQKNRCRLTSNICDGDDCYNKPSAYTYNFITLVSKLGIPPEGRTIFSLRGPVWYDDIDFDLKIVKIQAAANIEKAAENHFDTIKGKHEVHLSLKKTLEGPQDIELELSMTVFTNGLPRGKSVAKIFILVSQYTF